MNEEYIDPSAAEFDDAPNFSWRRTDGEIIALFFEPAIGGELKVRKVHIGCRDECSRRFSGCGGVRE